MTTRLRAGIIGGGFMGEVHARSIRIAGAEIAGIASSNLDRARDAAARVGVDRAATAEELISDPHIDVIHVCTPNASHVPLARAAIAAGKHVICEKPIGISLDEATQLTAEVEASDRLLTVPFAYRFHAMTREAKRRIAAHSFGELTGVTSIYHQDWLLEPGDDNWRVDAAAGGASRAFADIGSHLADLTEFLAGERIARLTARTKTVHGERNGRAVTTEDVAVLLVEFESGALGTLSISQIAAGRKNSLSVEIGGGHETVRFEQENPETLWIGHRGGSALLQRDPKLIGGDVARLSNVPSGHPLGYLDAFAAFIGDSYAAMSTGVIPDGLPTVRDGLRAVQLTERVLESAAQQGWVDA